MITIFIYKSFVLWLILILFNTNLECSHSGICILNTYVNKLLNLNDDVRRCIILWTSGRGENIVCGGGDACKGYVAMNHVILRRIALIINKHQNQTEELSCFYAGHTRNQYSREIDPLHVTTNYDVYTVLPRRVSRVLYGDVFKAPIVIFFFKIYWR